MKIDKSLAEEIIESALKKGADEAEIFAVNGKILSVEVKKGETDSLERAVDHGYCVRIVKDNREGFSYSTNPSGYDICVDNAIESSRWSEENRFLGFPSEDAHSGVEVFDPSIDSMREDIVKEMALKVEEAAIKTDTRITKTRKTSVSISSGETLIVNSRGISKSFRSTSTSSHTMVVAENGKDSQTGWDYQGSRFFDEMLFEEIGISAANRALRLLGAEKGRSAKAFVMLDNSIAAEFLSVFASALSAESVQKGKSLLAGKLGKSIVSDKIDIVDNALIDKLVGSRPFDAEGVPARNKTPVEKGVLRGYLYSTYTAKKDDTVSTGNAVRNGFKSIPSVGIMNMFIRPSDDKGVQPVDSVISSVDDGLLVTEAMGIHTANPISGDFSVGVTGIWIKGGTLSHPVKEAVISGNILELFKNVVMCADDLKFYGKIGSPSLLIQNVDISG
jgi:PmbA protein